MLSTYVSGNSALFFTGKSISKNKLGAAGHDEPQVALAQQGNSGSQTSYHACGRVAVAMGVVASVTLEL